VAEEVKSLVNQLQENKTLLEKELEKARDQIEEFRNKFIKSEIELQIDIGALQYEKNQLQFENRDLRADLNYIMQVNSDLHNKYSLYKDLLSNFRSELETTKSNANELKNKLTNLQVALEDNERKIKEDEDKMNQIREKLHKEIEANDDLSYVADKYAEKYKNALKILDANIDKLQKSDNEKADLKNNIRHLKQMNKDQISDLSIMLRGAEKAVQELLGYLSDEVVQKKLNPKNIKENVFGFPKKNSGGFHKTRRYKRRRNHRRKTRRSHPRNLQKK